MITVYRSMSIPVTLYAVVKCPQLLGSAGEEVFQRYLQTIRDFNAELSGSGSSPRGGVAGGVASSRIRI